jgi:hypothetical protein
MWSPYRVGVARGTAVDSGTADPVCGLTVGVEDEGPMRAHGHIQVLLRRKSACGRSSILCSTWMDLDRGLLAPADVMQLEPIPSVAINQ